MDPVVQVWLSVACHEGREWLSDYLKQHPHATAADVWNTIPRGDWVMFAAASAAASAVVNISESRRAELVPRSCAVAVAFARAILPAVQESNRDVCVRAIEVAEAVASGEHADLELSQATESAVWVRTRGLGLVAEAVVWSMTRSAWSTAAAVTAATVAATATSLTLPTADEVRALLGSAQDWLQATVDVGGPS